MAPIGRQETNSLNICQVIDTFGTALLKHELVFCTMLPKYCSLLPKQTNLCRSHWRSLVPLPQPVITHTTPLPLAPKKPEPAAANWAAAKNRPWMIWEWNIYNCFLCFFPNGTSTKNWESFFGNSVYLWGSRKSKFSHEKYPTWLFHVISLRFNHHFGGL